MYEVLVFAGGQNNVSNVSYVTQALLLATEALNNNSTQFVEVDHTQGRSSLGTFMVWIAQEKALVRLDRHREHFASDPEARYDPESLDVEFMGNDGVPFLEADHLTVSRTQAATALKVWLTEDKLTSELHWT